jgi:hypothetical protein
MTVYTSKPTLTESIFSTLSVGWQQIIITVKKWLGFAVCVQDQEGNAIAFRVDTSVIPPQVQVYFGGEWTDVA